MQLYFTKIFGCVALEESVPIDLSNLGGAILADRACPNIFLTFGESPFALFDAGITDINLGERRYAKYAIWHYYVGNLMVRIMYLDPVTPNLLPPKAWHPSAKSKYLKIHRL